VNDLMMFLPTIQFYHWRTFSHARHTAAGTLYEEMTGLIDQFMEVSISHTGKRPTLDKKRSRIVVETHTEKSIVAFLRSFVKRLASLRLEASDLANIRDEMLASVHRALYLFTQK